MPLFTLSSPVRMAAEVWTLIAQLWQCCQQGKVAGVEWTLATCHLPRTCCRRVKVADNQEEKPNFVVSG